MSSDFVDLQQISDLLMLTPRRIQQLAKDGTIPRAQRGKYDLNGCIQGYIRFLNSRVSPQESQGNDLYVQKVRLTSARAEIEEMELARSRGNLIPKDQVLATWTAMIAHMRARLLSIPTRAAPQVRAAQNNAKAQQVIKQYLYEALAELKDTSVDTKSKDVSP